VGAEFFHADRRTERHDEANSHFSQIYEERAQKNDQRTKSSKVPTKPSVLNRTRTEWRWWPIPLTTPSLFAKSPPRSHLRRSRILPYGRRMESGL